MQDTFLIYNYLQLMLPVLSNAIMSTVNSLFVCRPLSWDRRCMEMVTWLYSRRWTFLPQFMLKLEKCSIQVDVACLKFPVYWFP